MTTGTLPANITVELTPGDLRKLHARCGIKKADALLAVTEDRRSLIWEQIQDGRALVRANLRDGRYFILECRIIDGMTPEEKIARVITVVPPKRK